MYAWKASFKDEAVLRAYLHREFNEPFKGLGFYLTDKETVLITMSDRRGERATGDVPLKGNFRLHLYVFNCPFRQTVFSTTPRTADDRRSM